ncbi:hypothetical protein JXA88_15120 [Candidatus Fermentibacteria bacterium]|nr:hypothetical protein [Candidatus Fermentibacteria bacterium]
MSKIVLTSILLLALVFGPVSAANQVVVDGVPHVKNPASPAAGTEVLELEELWRAGGEDEDVVFGLITQVLVDEANSVYLLDTQLSQVEVFSADGEHLQTLSRQGEGPGETNSPVDMLFLPDTSIGLVQAFPGKIVKIRPDGTPTGSISVGGNDPAQGGFVLLIDALQRGGNLVLSGTRISMDQAQGTQTRTNFLSSFDMGGTEKVKYLEKAVQWDFKNLKITEEEQHFVHFRRWTMGPDGRIYAAPHRNRYAIEVYAPEGTLERVIERAYTSLNRTEADMARINAIADSQKKQIPVPVDMQLCDTEPDIGRLHIADDGTLWVQTSQGNRNQPTGIITTFDVFDPAGVFVKQVQVKCPGNGEKDGVIFGRNGRMICIKGFLEAAMALQGGGGADEAGEEPEPMEVICYKAKVQ